MISKDLTPETAGISTDLQDFTHETLGSIRAVNINGVPWFLGSDVTCILDYKNGSRDINRHVDQEDRQNYRNGTIGGIKGVKLINLSGLMMLVLRCELPQAKPFQKWVTSVVLPSVLLHGGYLTPAKLNEVEADPEELQRLAEKLRDENTALLPKAAFYDRVLEDKEFLSVTAIALELGTSARILNKRLEELGVQHKATGGGWIPAYEYDDCEYVKIYEYKNPAGVTGVRTLWTQVGRQLIKDLLTNKGVA